MRLEVPDEKKLVFEMTIPIRWGDMDARQHVNNVAYFRYFETLRVDWMDSIGASPSTNSDGPVIVNAFCNFIKQLEFPGLILARHYLAHLGRTSFDTFMTLQRVDEPHVLCANGGATVVWVDKHLVPTPIPSWLRAHL